MTVQIQVSKEHLPHTPEGGFSQTADGMKQFGSQKYKKCTV